jgi:hypothetical protein
MPDSAPTPPLTPILNAATYPRPEFDGRIDISVLFSPLRHYARQVSRLLAFRADVNRRVWIESVSPAQLNAPTCSICLRPKDRLLTVKSITLPSTEQEAPLLIRAGVEARDNFYSACFPCLAELIFLHAVQAEDLSQRAKAARESRED